MTKQPRDEDGIPLKHGDYITFSFGIPSICVTAQLSCIDGNWGVECLHPSDVKPRRTTLPELTKYYQVYKASRDRVAAVLKDARDV